MDLGFNLAQSNRDLKDLTSRQNFGATSGLLCKNDLIPCPIRRALWTNWVATVWAWNDNFKRFWPGSHAMPCHQLPVVQFCNHTRTNCRLGQIKLANADGILMSRAPLAWHCKKVTALAPWNGIVAAGNGISGSIGIENGRRQCYVLMRIWLTCVLGLIRKVTRRKL